MPSVHPSRSPLWYWTPTSFLPSTEDRQWITKQRRLVCCSGKLRRMGHSTDHQLDFAMGKWKVINRATRPRDIASIFVARCCSSQTFVHLYSPVGSVDTPINLQGFWTGGQLHHVHICTILNACITQISIAYEHELLSILLHDEHPYFADLWLSTPVARCQ